MSENEIKVSDKRIFTPDGELREQHDHPGDAESEPSIPEDSAPEEIRASGESSGQNEDPESARSPNEEPAFPNARVDIPGRPPELGAPTFFDLLAMLAEPVSLYLGDVELPDGRNVENLDMARLHIDMLDTLRQKTQGNLTAQEIQVLDDIVYRLRLRYVEKRG